MSATSSAALPPRLSRKKLTVVELDVSRSTWLIGEIGDDNRAVMFFDGFYTLCTQHIEAHGGEVIKYLGDACLAIFDEDACVQAIDAVIAIRDAFPGYCRTSDVPPAEIHGAVHIGELVVGEFGPQGFKDVMGRTPSTLFKMAGSGIAISEQAYRKLPSDRRAAWRKRGGQVTYVLK
jgi:class 3 adenylate cyclase